MRIAVVVPGRFFAFDLAVALIRRGHDVTVFTNYPVWAAQRFGLRSENIRSFWMHGVVSRIVNRLGQALPSLCDTPELHRIFGRWAAKEISRENWDIVHLYSGTAQEVLEGGRRAGYYTQLVRASAHIRVQDRLLAEEETRSGQAIERPAAWMIAREEREYELCDEIVTVSGFAYNTFLEEGIRETKLRLLPLGVDVSHFRPDAGLVAERRRRIRAGDPLRVLYVGVVSYQKGLLDFARVVEAMRGLRVQFRFVGRIPPESRSAIGRISDAVEIIPHQPQSELPYWYAQSDLFMFPTIQDGFGVVLAQANASALPILTTTNCCGPELIREGKTGWTLPIREPQAFVDRLLWCDQNRSQLADMVEHLYQTFRPRDWSSVAEDFEAICLQRLH